jgi:hypothetical protein
MGAVRALEATGRCGKRIAVRIRCRCDANALQTHDMHDMHERPDDTAIIAPNARGRHRLIGYNGAFAQRYGPAAAAIAVDARLWSPLAVIPHGRGP